MNLKFKLRPQDYLILLIAVMLTIFCFTDVASKKEIRNNGKSIIVMLTEKDELPKKTTYYFTYYYNDVKNIVTNCGVQHSVFNSDKEDRMIDSLKIGRYYYAKFLPKYSNIIVVDPTKEVTDKKTIEKAGFINYMQKPSANSGFAQ